MTVLVVETAGGTTTLQDGGRLHAARFGVPRSGPVDRLSHRLAARLAGVAAASVAGTTAIEVGPRGCTLVAEGRVAIALAGAGASIAGPLLGHVAAPCVVRLSPGERATVRAPTWAYVVPAGAVEVPAVLGSRSTHARSGLGPVVEDGTRLSLGSSRDVVVGQRSVAVADAGALSLLAGPQTPLFTRSALRALVGEPFRTTSAFDRMGQRLDGPRLAAVAGHDIVSDGVVPGALQVPGDGLPFVLTADHQTTGGYPKIAVLSTASLARFVRRPPGTEVRFRWSDERAAHDELAAALAAIERCVAAPVRPTASQLAAANLVDGVTDGG